MVDAAPPPGRASTHWPILFSTMTGIAARILHHLQGRFWLMFIVTSMTYSFFCYQCITGTHARKQSSPRPMLRWVICNASGITR
jgi:hypothetical protein